MWFLAQLDIGHKVLRTLSLTLLRAQKLIKVKRQHTPTQVHAQRQSLRRKRAIKHLWCKRTRCILIWSAGSLSFAHYMESIEKRVLGNIFRRRASVFARECFNFSGIWPMAIPHGNWTRGRILRSAVCDRIVNTYFRLATRYWAIINSYIRGETGRLTCFGPNRIYRVWLVRYGWWVWTAIICLRH